MIPHVSLGRSMVSSRCSLLENLPKNGFVKAKTSILWLLPIPNISLWYFWVPQVIVADNKGNLGFYNLIQDLGSGLEIVHSDAPGFSTSIIWINLGYSLQKKNYITPIHSLFFPIHLLSHCTPPKKSTSGDLDRLEKRGLTSFRPPPGNIRGAMGDQLDIFYDR